ncbi:hypothetical protein PRIPAC_87925, partial [Pristionchus pacificus]|uniref:IlGF domain-containing protein n=1 Tax=Pristionchus pacificus TaxID=54126 RepID=A0A2A6B7A0_PRIPA
AKFAEKRRDGGFRAGKMSFASRVLLPLLLSSMVSTVTSQRLCGRRLIKALSVVCDHKYHRPTREQLNTVRSRSSGIATKCCRNRCPYEELSRCCSVIK